MEELTQTVNLQPALVAVDMICLFAVQQAGITPYAVAGHSLGEYPALAACGAISAEDCLSLVALRGKLMDREAGKYPGAMSALMGLSPDEVAELTQEVKGVVQPANYNTPVQTVITGAKDAVAKAEALAKERGAKAIPLKVSGPWHSPFMAVAQKEMEAAIEDTAFNPPSCLHVPNTTAEATNDAALIKSELKKQLTSPVRWVQTINGLIEAGVDTFVECGPKNVLSGLIKKTAPKGVNLLRFDTPESLDKVKEALS
jgi:[acyl-carrier-protein] S-malonyltransferase